MNRPTEQQFLSMIHATETQRGSVVSGTFGPSGILTANVLTAKQLEARAAAAKKLTDYRYDLASLTADERAALNQP